MSGLSVGSWIEANGKLELLADQPLKLFTGLFAFQLFRVQQMIHIFEIKFQCLVTKIHLISLFFLNSSQIQLNIFDSF